MSSRIMFPFSLMRSQSMSSLSSSKSTPKSSSQLAQILAIDATTPSISTPVVRPRLTRQKKRVSFDASLPPTSPISFDEESQPRSFSDSMSSSSSEDMDSILRKRRKSEIDSSVDLRAVLAAGIIEWRNEVDSGAVEDEEVDA
ncbi:hypothetical protein FRC02_002515 [Tulasnella sp. 418]|nr:hypothetical protein FRC02_002515 [Tulasnella sp. 418]